MKELIGLNIENADLEMLIEKEREPIITDDGTIYDLISADGYGLDGQICYNYEFVRFQNGQIEEHSPYPDFDYNAVMDPGDLPNDLP